MKLFMYSFRRAMAQSYAAMQKLLMLFLFAAITIGARAQTELFVDATLGNDANAGTSWAAAYKTLAKAMNVMNANTGTAYDIHVAEGVYYPAGSQGHTMRDSAFTILRGNIRLFGGYPTGGGVRDWNAHITWLDGYLGDLPPESPEIPDSVWHIMVIVGVTEDSVVVDGFSFRAGMAIGVNSSANPKMYNGHVVRRSDGGGIMAVNNTNGKQLNIRNCHFSGNRATSGGGIAVYSVFPITSTPLINNCTFTKNRANIGSGLFIERSSPEVLNCSFREATGQSGGGIYINNNSSPLISGCSFIKNNISLGAGIFNGSVGQPEIINCDFSENIAEFGGGIYNDNSPVEGFSTSFQVINSRFFKNIATWNGGGIANRFGALCEVINCSFSGNGALIQGGGQGGGIYNQNSTCNVTNSIFWGNFYAPGGIAQPNSVQGVTSITYSIVEQASVYPGTGNKNIDPLIVNGLTGDLHLQACSPAINAGLNSANTTTLDLDGNPRIAFSTIDMGAYESLTAPDSEKPTITCPANITVSNDAGKCSAVVSFTGSNAASATDNCPGLGIVSYSIASGTEFPVGETTVTALVTDGAGNTNTCDFTVTVVDNENPIITCPDNIVVNNDPGKCGAVVNFSVPATDNCSGVGTVSLSHASGATFPFGTTTVTAHVTDAAGNTSTCSFTVTVNDTQAPTITCPDNITQKADPGQCSAVVNFPGAATNDCGGTPSISYSPASGATFQLGTTTVTATATDAAGNTTSCTFTVTVEDREGPEFTSCPAGQYLGYNPTGIPAPGTPTTTDNCSGPVSITSTQESVVENGCNRSQSRIYTATDAAGNRTTCKQTFTWIEDNMPPTFTCPGNITQNTDPGQCTATVSFSANATDNCDNNVSVSYKVGTASISSGATFQLGTTTVTATATDAAGNTTSCTFTVTVEDKQPPTINCPQNVSVNMDLGACYATVTNTALGNPIVSDNCPGVTYSAAGVPAGNKFPKGETTVTWTATDAHGNTTSCTQKVTVTDNQPPTITSVTANPASLWPPNHKMRDIAVAVVSTDNCGTPNCIITSVASNEPINGTGDGDVSPDWIISADKKSVQLRAERAGNGDGRIYTLTVTCTDGSGNSTSKTTNVYVAHNITAPVTGTSFKIGSTVSFAGTFWDVPGNRHTAKWLIDGATSVKGTVTEPSGSKVGKVTGSYKFGSAGVYKLQMDVTDQSGVTSYANTAGDLDAIVVIYDPNGGYTYGGGWFASQQGALTSAPAATGKVSYGFTVNYYKGASLPKGETQFEFKVGNFEYNALNFDYLAISGARAQFKGTGKIVGGQSGISFIMTVIDGALDGTGVDKARIRIYNKNTGQVYYDNEPGQNEAANPTTKVGAGSQVVISGGGVRTEAVVTRTEPVSEVQDLQLRVLPNPANNVFNVFVRSDNQRDKIELEVFDLYGRKIEQRTVAGELTRIGANYRPGTYFIRVVQGGQVREAKLLKLPD